MALRPTCIFFHGRIAGPQVLLRFVGPFRAFRLSIKSALRPLAAGDAKRPDMTHRGFENLFSGPETENKSGHETDSFKSKRRIDMNKDEKQTGEFS